VVVRLEPLGVDIPISNGVSLMRAAQDLGLAWPTVCGGDAECGTCFVTMGPADAARLPPASPHEEQALRLIPPRPSQADDDVVRLACQLRPTANIVVRKRGVRWR
jgi:2Fe-2S ferredoxin